MNKSADGILTWKIEEIAQALKISNKYVREYFTDGRRVSFILERRIAFEIFKGRLASSEGAGYDLIDPNGDKWEVRSITRRGIYFCPSYMVGSGRSFNEKGFLEKLTDIKGYVISDVESFPNIPFWIITSDQVLSWWNKGKLSKSSHLSRSKALSMISEKNK